MGHHTKQILIYENLKNLWSINQIMDISCRHQDTYTCKVWRYFDERCLRYWSGRTDGRTYTRTHADHCYIPIRLMSVRIISMPGTFARKRARLLRFLHARTKYLFYGRCFSPIFDLQLLGGALIREGALIMDNTVYALSRNLQCFFPLTHWLLVNSHLVHDSVPQQLLRQAPAA